MGTQRPLRISWILLLAIGLVPPRSPASQRLPLPDHGPATAARRGALLSASVAHSSTTAPYPEPTVVPREPEEAEDPPAAMDAEEAASVETENTPEEGDAAEEESLLQLLADAEAAVAANSFTSDTQRSALRNALRRLAAALESKARTLEDGTGEVEEGEDRAIEETEQELDEAVSSVQENPDASGDLPEEAAEPGFAGEISGLLDSGIRLLHKVQEIRGVLRDVPEEQSVETEEPAESRSQAGEGEEEGEDVEEVAVEQELGEVAGVVSEDGQPVQGAVVSDTAAGVSATTDENGAFVLEGIPGRTRDLLIRRAGREVGRGPVEARRGRAVIADFDLGARSRSRQGGKVTPRVLSSVVIVQGRSSPAETGTVRGIVMKAGGKPLARALVRLDGLGLARTNNRGKYLFRRVPAGPHRITVLAPRRRPQSETVRVTASRTAESRFRIEPEERRRAAGQILHDGSGGAGLSGIVRDENNRPLVAARVVIAAGGKVIRTKTRSGGKYSVRGLRPGSYRVFVSKVGYRDAAEQVSLRSGDGERLDFRLSTATSLTSLRAAARGRSRLVEVRGRVSGTNRDAIPGASVRLTTRGSRGAAIAARTNSRGEYVLRAFPGLHEVKVEKRGFGKISRPITLKAQVSRREDFVLTGRALKDRRGPSEADLRGNSAIPRDRPERREEKSRVRSDRSRWAVSGRVTDDRSGRPILGATVTLSHTGELMPSLRSDRTDRDGSFTVEADAPGPYRIRAARSGYRAEEKTLRLGSDRAVSVHLRLRPGAAKSLPRASKRFPHDGFNRQPVPKKKGVIP